MIESRLQAEQEIKLERVRIMHESSGLSVLKDAFLDSLEKWAKAPSSHRITPELMEIDDLRECLLFVD
jgi:hypothetical protein